MAAEEMEVPRQGWGWAPHRGLEMSPLVVGQQDGYGVVGLWFGLGRKWGGW
jgi:hypothetical protein